MIAVEAALCGFGALLIVGPRAGAPLEHHGTMLGAASGILFGVSDISIKALTGIVGAHGVFGLLSPWLALTLLASVVAFFASAKSFQEGEAVPVIAITGATANLSGDRRRDPRIRRPDAHRRRSASSPQRTRTGRDRCSPRR